MTDPSEAVALEPPPTRWPNVIGVIGIVLSLVTLVDKVGDLLVLTVSDANWIRWFGVEAGSLVVRLMPPDWWLAITSLVWIALSVLLLRGSLALRLRKQSGVSLSSLWSRFAIVWIVVDFNLALWWARRVSAELPLPADGWQGIAVAGVLFGLILLLAYPVFLLVWFARPAVRAEHASWTR